jgi:regulatory protein
VKPARHGSPGPSLRARALRLLSQREHSRAELQSKLLRQVQASARRRAAEVAHGRRGVCPAGAADGAHPVGWVDAADAAGLAASVDTADGADEAHDTAALRQQLAALLDELQGHGLLSDERAAASLLAVRAPRHGERRLQRDLQAKGLAPELVAQTLAQARETELPRALALWQRRYGQVAADDTSHARQVRFLAGRGFSMDTITRVLRQARAAAREGVDAALERERQTDADAS